MQFKSVKVDFTFLLTYLPKLVPRIYSISSTPSVTLRQVHITVGIVEYKTKKGERTHYGVCSKWLDQKPLESSICAYLRE